MRNRLQELPLVFRVSPPQVLRWSNEILQLGTIESEKSTQHGIHTSRVFHATSETISIPHDL